jgi:saccharopine dehydrogenase-like NADP-dependent oxidoreductase
MSRDFSLCGACGEPIAFHETINMCTHENALNKIQSLTKRIEILEHDNKKLVETVRFYGDKGNWENVEAEHYKEAIKLDDCGYLDVNKVYTDAIRYGGKRARETMKELRGEYGFKMEKHAKLIESLNE